MTRSDQGGNDCPREFICTDCGRNIISYNDPGSDRCGVCDWIREFVPPPDHEVLRERMGVPLVRKDH